MLKKWFLLFMAVSFVAAPAMAMPMNMPQGKWWHRPQMAKALNLTDDEIKTLDSLFQKSAPSLIDLKGEMQKQFLSLRAVSTDPSAGNDAILRQFKDVQAARTNLATEHFRFLMQVRDVLGVERANELKEKLKAMRQGMHRGDGRGKKMQGPCPQGEDFGPPGGGPRDKMSGPRGRWWNRPKLAEALNLTDNEKKTLDSLYQKSASSLIDLKGEMQKQFLNLDTLASDPSVKSDAIMSQFKNVQKARTNLATERFRFILQVRETIGVQRFAELKDKMMSVRQAMRNQKGCKMGKKGRGFQGPPMDDDFDGPPPDDDFQGPPPDDGAWD